MQIAIDLPKDFVQFQSESDIQQEIRTSYAVWLYQHQLVGDEERTASVVIDAVHAVHRILRSVQLNQ